MTTDLHGTYYGWTGEGGQAQGAGVSDSEDNEFTPVMTPDFSRAASPVPPQSQSLSRGGHNNNNVDTKGVSSPSRPASAAATTGSKTASSGVNKARFKPRVSSKVLDSTSKGIYIQYTAISLSFFLHFLANYTWFIMIFPFLIVCVRMCARSVEKISKSYYNPDI